jgi:hypothetical protein
VLAVCALLVPGCGGRIARPVADSSGIDASLSCSHLAAEYRVNLQRIRDIAGEEAGKLDDNLGWLLVMPLFIDLSAAERAEIEALAARNQRLVELAGERGCQPLQAVTRSGRALTLR